MAFQFEENTVYKKYIGRTGHKPNFVLGTVPISAPVHDDSGKFRNYCKDTKNGLPYVTFSGALVVSGGEFVGVSRECVITIGPF